LLKRRVNLNSRKSQLAIKYALNIRQKSLNTHVLWVHSVTAARFEEEYRRIADKLQLPGRQDPKTNVLELVYNWLSSEENGQWIMIIDSVDDINVFFSSESSQSGTAPSSQQSLALFLPQSSNGRILITSRSRDVAERLTGSYWNVRPIAAMAEDQAQQLLQNKLQTLYDKEVAGDLVRALEYLPLALTQAAAYILRRAPRMTPRIYLDQLRKSNKSKASLLNKNMGDLRRSPDAANSVVMTWQLTFEQIQRESPSAADLLSLMSFFNPQGIPEWVLRNFYRTKYLDETTNPDIEEGAERRDSDVSIQDSADLSDDSTQDYEFDDDLDLLRGYSLVTATNVEDECEMHALVQFCTQVWLSSNSNTTERWKRIFLRVMSSEYPDCDDFEEWAKCRQLDWHIENIIAKQPSTEDDTQNWLTLMSKAGRFARDTGRYQVSESLLRTAALVSERTTGKDSISTLHADQNLARSLRIMGKYDEAEMLFRSSLEGFEQLSGTEHLNALGAANNLALVLGNKGHYGEAERLYQRALEGYEKELGVEHPYTFTTIDNIALVLQKQGRYDEAERLYRRALEGREKKLGVEHPDTLTTVNNLALLLNDQGHYDEAERLYRRALEGSEKKLGIEHPDTLATVNNLALVLNDQGHYDEAEPLYRRALEDREIILGIDHPDTLTTVSNLALLLNTQGHYDEAERLYRRVLEGSEKKLGTEHHDTLAAVNNLALVLGNKGHYGEAERLYRRALSGYEDKLGMEHPDTLATANNLALLLNNQGHYDEAERLYRRVLEGSEKKLGIEHPDTLNTVNNLALLLNKQGYYNEAERLYRRALSGREKKLGMEHPNTLATANNLALLLNNQGHYDEAERLRWPAGSQVTRRNSA
jgi:tetratricopeptide (TPR) repeat protein